MMERILKVELKSAGAAFGLFVASIATAMGIQIGKTETEILHAHMHAIRSIYSMYSISSLT